MTFTPVMYYKGGRSIFATSRAIAVDLEYNGWVKNPTATPPPADPPPGGGTGLQLGTTSTTAKRGDYTPSWLEVTGKPSTFPPEAHLHPVTALSDASAVGKSILTAASAGAIRTLLGVDSAGTSNLQLGTTATTAKPGDYVPDWAELTNKPSTFAPTTGTTANTAKPGNYVPDWAELTNKPATFAPVVGTTATTAKAGNYVPTWTEITSKPTTFAPATHTHPAADITGALAYANAVPGTAFMVTHGTNATMARPSSRTDIFFFWSGSVAPTNMLAGDNWINTTP